MSWQINSFKNNKLLTNKKWWINSNAFETFLLLSFFLFEKRRTSLYVKNISFIDKIRHSHYRESIKIRAKKIKKQNTTIHSLCVCMFVCVPHGTYYAFTPATILLWFDSWRAAFDCQLIYVWKISLWQECTVARALKFFHSSSAAFPTLVQCKIYVLIAHTITLCDYLCGNVFQSKEKKMQQLKKSMNIKTFCISYYHTCVIHMPYSISNKFCLSVCVFNATFLLDASYVR
jgi:hypothetical protein